MEQYQLLLACELLLKPEAYPQFEGQYVVLDLFDVRTVIREHLVADKVRALSLVEPLQ